MARTIPRNQLWHGRDWEMWSFYFKRLFIYLLTWFWLCWVFVAASRGSSPVSVWGPLAAVALWSSGSHTRRFQSLWCKPANPGPLHRQVDSQPPDRQESPRCGLFRWALAHPECNVFLLVWKERVVLVGDSDHIGNLKKNCPINSCSSFLVESAISTEFPL